MTLYQITTNIGYISNREEPHHDPLFTPRYTQTDRLNDILKDMNANQRKLYDHLNQPNLGVQERVILARAIEMGYYAGVAFMIVGIQYTDGFINHFEAALRLVKKGLARDLGYERGCGRRIAIDVPPEFLL